MIETLPDIDANSMSDLAIMRLLNARRGWNEGLFHTEGLQGVDHGDAAGRGMYPIALIGNGKWAWRQVPDLHTNRTVRHACDAIDGQSSLQ